MADAALVQELAPAGELRACINLGNPVLAQGSPASLAGVTVDLAREFAARLDVPLRLVPFDAARRSFAALAAGEADVAFLAIEPARAAQVAFTAPYVLIEGVYAVAEDSPLTSASEVDRPGVRIGVGEGSAYDLFLTRTLRHAQLVRGEDGIDLFVTCGLEATAHVRQPLTRYVETHPGLRLLEPRFMEIRQAAAIPTARGPRALATLAGWIEELKASGFVAESLTRSGQVASVAPPA
jgi:polar amino acid transport system substrate-binding protein